MIPVVSTPWLILGALIGLSAIAGGSYLKGRSDGKAGEIARHAREEEIRLETLQLAQLATAEEIGRIQITHKTIRAEVEREVLTREIYRDCAHPDDVFRLLNDAIDNRPAEPAGDRLMPGADTAAR